MNKDFQDRIDEYIFGRMSDEEKAQFETEINQDESKKEQLEFTKNVKRAISSREDKLARMKMMQKQYEREHHQAAATQYAEKKSSKRIWWWASGIAAVFAMGLFVVNPFRNEFSPIGSSPNEIIRGEENDVFDIESPILNDSIVNDTIPPIVKEKPNKVNE